MLAPPGPPLIRTGPTILLLGLFASVAFLVSCGPSEPPVVPPLEIAVVDVVQRDQPIKIDMVGETRGSSDIPIRARVEGVLTGMYFTEGRSVEEGQLLYTIDPEPFQQEVVEAEGSVAEAITIRANAKSNLDRIRPLAEMKAVSESDLDSAVAQFEAATGSLQSARARVRQAEIRLGYTDIHAPIAGRISISEARVGEFVGRSPNPVVLNFVSLIDPIRVRFSIDERTYLALARKLHELRKETVTEDVQQQLVLTLADGTVHPFPGRVVAADAAINPKTGTFTIEADFANPDGIVLAGQFARVRATTKVVEGAVLVPSRSASELQGIFRVFVIGDDGKVELRPVELGPVVDNFRIVTSGLEPGERVAIEIMRLKPGMTVKPKLVALNEDGTIAKSDDRKESASPNPTEASDASDASDGDTKSSGGDGEKAT
jgi:membrane fusion protein (multidrug efflux system)